MKKYRCVPEKELITILEAANKHVFYSYIESMMPNRVPKTAFVFP